MKLGLKCRLNGIAIQELKLFRPRADLPVIIGEASAVYLHDSDNGIFPAGTANLVGEWPKALVDKAEEFVALLEDHLAQSQVFEGGGGTNYIRKDEPRDGIV